MIIINHGNGYTSRYAHLNLAGVAAGDRVIVRNGIAGVIGWSGNSGNARDPDEDEYHVHWEMRKNNVALNPEVFLNSPCPRDFDPR